MSILSAQNPHKAQKKNRKSFRFYALRENDKRQEY